MAATEGNTDVVKMLFEQAELRDSWVTIQNVSGIEVQVVWT